MKTCSRCTHTLPASDFYANLANSDLLDTYCKGCRKTYARAAYAKNGQRAASRTRVAGAVYGYQKKNISALVVEREALFAVGQRRCRTCSVVKDLTQYDRTNGRLNLRCRACLRSPQGTSP